MYLENKICVNTGIFMFILLIGIVFFNSEAKGSDDRAINTFSLNPSMITHFHNHLVGFHEGFSGEINNGAKKMNIHDFLNNLGSPDPSVNKFLNNR